jgi:1-acyl-sn-glycerol-3-phosphate acyltransferase
MRASIMAKKELQWMPFLGQFLTASGAVFVDRGNNAKAVRSLAAAGEAMHARNTSLWLFPEGTRSMRPYHDLLSFKKGAFHLAVQAGVPIVPVVCENYWHLYRKNVFGNGTLTIRGTRGWLLLGSVRPLTPTSPAARADGRAHHGGRQRSRGARPPAHDRSASRHLKPERTAATDYRLKDCGHAPGCRKTGPRAQYRSCA